MARDREKAGPDGASEHLTRTEPWSGPGDAMPVLSSDGSCGAHFAPGIGLNGRYRIDGLIGRGGMGEVYRARHVKLGRSVAVKILQSELASEPRRLRRFEREARAEGPPAAATSRPRTSPRRRRPPPPTQTTRAGSCARTTAGSAAACSKPRPSPVGRLLRNWRNTGGGDHDCPAARSRSRAPGGVHLAE